MPQFPFLRGELWVQVQQRAEASLLQEQEEGEPRTAAASGGEASQGQGTSYPNQFPNTARLPTIGRTEAFPSLCTASPASVTGPVNFILDSEN